jgi:hypothetical protein
MCISEQVIIMYNIKSISIPTPCHQSWQQMEQKEQGRYCTGCTKIVIDFTKMTNEQILAYLANSKNVCGRFDEYQLAGINYQLGLKKAPGSFYWKKWLVAAGVLGAGFFNKADAQAAKAVTAVQQQPLSKSHLPDQTVPAGKAHKHLHKKMKQRGADGGSIKIDKSELAACRSDIAGMAQKFEPLPGQVVFVDQDISMELKGRVGGVSVSGIEVNTQSRVEMFYQYMPWPINKLFK